MTPVPSQPNPYGLRFRLPYLAGVYLAVNAIPDSALVVDGPMCGAYKIEQIQGNHDIRADLSRLGFSDRIVHTHLQVNEAVLGEEKPFFDALRRAARAVDNSLVLATGASCSLLIGRDIERLARTFMESEDVPVVAVRSRPLEGDWLDGYDEALTALAKDLPLTVPEERNPARPEGHAPRVGIVGYFHTRHEGDTAADLAELERMVSAVGGSLVSVWLSGKPYATLSDIAQADVIVSLPYATKAARILSRRTGADLLELPYPFSFSRARDFVLALGEKFGTRDQSEAFVEGEAARMSQSLLFLSAQNLLSSRWFIVADAVHVAGFSEIAADVGASVAGALILSRRRKNDPVPTPSVTGEAVRVSYGHEPDWSEAMRRARKSRALDLVIGNGAFANSAVQAGCPFLEFGYPSYTYHPMFEIPSLGFRGQEALVSRMAEKLAFARLTAEQGQGEGRD